MLTGNAANVTTTSTEVEWRVECESTEKKTISRCKSMHLLT